MLKKDGGPHYPVDTSCGFTSGASHRQWLAGLAMARLLEPEDIRSHSTYDEIAAEAYEMADRMIKADAEGE